MTFFVENNFREIERFLQKTGKCEGVSEVREKIREKICGH